MTQAYPLQWPQGRPRTKSRTRARFNKTGSNGWEKIALSVADAIGRVQNEIERLGARQYVLSTNLETRLDGLPRSGQREPDDPGVALYFHLDGKPHCLPCDTYDRVADNIAAIAKHIEAARAIERYGVASMSEMFAGFTALPAPGQEAKRSWREVLAFGTDDQPTPDLIRAHYRHFASKRHPDAPGGSHDAMSELNRARDEALGEIGAHP